MDILTVLKGVIQLRRKGAAMISLNYRDARPIYEQVRDALRHLVITGAVEEGERFPSVRALAASLAINPNTIQRAYAALEEEGYLTSEPGRGAFAARGGAGENRRREELLTQFDASARELLFLGMTPEELAERVNRAGRGGRPGSPRPAGEEAWPELEEGGEEA